MKAYYDEKPSVISEVGNGSILYRYGIEKIETSTFEVGKEERLHTQYVCQEVVVWKPITSNKITEAVITDRWDNNYEQKLVNEYNAAQIGLLGEEAKTRVEAYTNYLKERALLKEQVDADCKELGID